jgi:glycosyltransferase involved in cell wall biosynthesis
VSASHDAIVLPYTEDFTAQSGVVFLAIAHGTPVIASEAGGLRDLFRKFQIGRTFREPAPDALADAVRQCVGESATGAFDEPLRAARQHFSWEATAEATVPFSTVMIAWWGVMTSATILSARSPNPACLDVNSATIS